MTEVPELSDLDRRILMALQVNGRASWRKIATALEVSESTVTRRGQQLLAERRVAVTGVLDHLRCGLGISVYLRLRARPGKALSVARSVAAEARPRFVTVAIGSFDVAAEVVVERPGDIAQMIEGLDAIDDVLETESMVVIRKFCAFEDEEPRRSRRPSWVTCCARALRSRTMPTATGPSHNSAPLRSSPSRRCWRSTAERRTPRSQPGRAPASPPSPVGWSRCRGTRAASGSAASSRPPRSASTSSSCSGSRWIPHASTRWGSEIAKHASTRYVSAATGRHNLIVQGVLPTYGDLYPYTTDVIGQLPGVQSADLTLQVQVLKRAFVPIDDAGRPQGRETS